MHVTATVQVDYQFTPDGERTLARTSDVVSGSEPVRGDTVLATDGEETHLALVDSVESQTLSLAVLWDAAVPSARAV